MGGWWVCGLLLGGEVLFSRMMVGPRFVAVSFRASHTIFNTTGLDTCNFGRPLHLLLKRCLVSFCLDYEVTFSFILPGTRIHISPSTPPQGRNTPMAEGRSPGAAAGSSTSTSQQPRGGLRHAEDPLAVLLTKVERTLQQLAVLEAEEQRRRGVGPAAEALAPTAAPPPPRQAALSAFAFSQQHHINKVRVHPIDESVPSVPPSRLATE